MNERDRKEINDETTLKQLFDNFVREITKEDYDKYRNFWNNKDGYRPNEVVSVTELAFACAGEKDSKVSLWFDLPVVCSPSQKEIKKHKREKQRQHQTLKDGDHQEISAYPGGSRNGKNLFQNHPHKPFFHMQTHSNEGYTLTQSILVHRIEVLISKLLPLSGSIYLGNKEKYLKVAFENLKNHSSSWHWPVSEGRETVTADTPIPVCGVEYHPSKSSSHARKMWQSFYCNMRDTGEAHDTEKNKEHGLPIFRQLATGRNNETNQMLPHIKRFCTIASSCDNEQKPLATNMAWKSMLFNSPEHRDWQMVKAHYLSSKAPNNKKEKGMPLSPTQGDKNASIA